MTSRLAREYYLEVHAIRNSDSHDLSKRLVVGIEVDKSMMDSQLPVIDGARSSTIRSFSDGHTEVPRREWHRPGHRHGGSFGDLFNLLTHVIELRYVGTGQSYSRARPPHVVPDKAEPAPKIRLSEHEHRLREVIRSPPDAFAS